MTTRFTQILLFSIVHIFINAQACDENLSIFSRDCTVQNEYRAIRSSLENEGVSIDQILIYRALRFIDFNSLQSANKNRLPVQDIYRPNPQTWLVWSAGIDLLFKDSDLNRKFKLGLLTKQDLEFINRSLLEQNGVNIKDFNSDSRKRAGEMRQPGDIEVVYCTGDLDIEKNKIQSANQSMLRFHERLISTELISDTEYFWNKDNRQISYFEIDFNYVPVACHHGPKSGQVYYLKSEDVQNYIDQFLNLLNRYLSDPHFQSQFPPIEMAAFFQKWFVSIHPFSDGNGRTSRAIQELILNRFNLPMAQSGLTQEDVTLTLQDYVEHTYRSLEYTLDFLKKCDEKFDYKKTTSELDYFCQAL